jgi:REP element-mobilizing transposase RayT
MRLSRFGRIVGAEWLRTAELRPNLHLGEYVVMPNHVHGVIFLTESGVSAADSHAERPETPARTFGKPVPGSLASVLRSFKAAVTRRINAIQANPVSDVWQPNYYEHIVRSAEDLDRIAYYIRTNPERWDRDRENPQARVVDDDWPFEDGGMSAGLIQPEGR